MKTDTKTVQEITQLATDYIPGDTTRAQLASKTLVPIIGPSAIGKNTIMNEVLRLDSDFGRAAGFTTRPRRDGEAEETYTFIPHTNEHLEQIRLRLQNQELVQVAVFPTTGMIYGSGLEDYQNTYTVIDFLASSMNDLKPLGFKKIEAIALVAPVDEWKAWLQERFKEVNEDEYKKRLQEAAMSLSWVLSHLDEVHLQLNHDGDMKQTATKVIAVCKGEHIEQAPVELAHSMLDHVRTALKTL